MKNITKLKAMRSIAGIIALMAIIGFGMAACGGDDAPSLTAPSNVRIDADTFTLKWDPVSGASKYEIDIDGELFSVTKTDYDLKKLTEDPKLYTIKVRAVFGAVESAYSAALECEPALYVFTFGPVSPSVQYARAGGPAGAAAGPAVTGLTAYGKTLEKIVIPAKVGAVDITTIGKEAFKGNDIMKEVVIATSITDIGDSAFSGCTVLVIVVFLAPEAPTMGSDVFKGSDMIEEIAVPPGSSGSYETALPGLSDLIEEDDTLPPAPLNSTITITGLAAWNDIVQANIWSRDALDAMESGNENYEEPEIFGYGEINNGSVTITFKAASENWVDDGKGGYWDSTESNWSPQAGKNYWLVFSIYRKDDPSPDPVVYGTDWAQYLYSNGQNFNIAADTDFETFDIFAFMKTVSYFDFSQSTVDLSKFWQTPEGMFGSEDGYDPDDPDGKP